MTDNGNDDPAAHAEEADTLSMAFLLLLERLSPVERAVFLLHDVFGYGYDEIAGIVGKTESNCRQPPCVPAAVSKRSDLGSPRRVGRRQLAERFFAAEGRRHGRAGRASRRRRGRLRRRRRQGRPG